MSARSSNYLGQRNGVPAAGAVQWLVVFAGERGEVEGDRS